MGFFSAKKTISVSSVVYNMAGDEDDRPDFLKSVLVGQNQQRDKKKPVTLAGAYLRGPGIKLRNYASWGRRSGYNNQLGLTNSSLSLTGAANFDLLKPHLPIGNGDEAIIQSASIEGANYSMWAAQRVSEQYPKKFYEDWEADFDEPTRRITLRVPGEMVTNFSITGYNPGGYYLYCTYVVRFEEERTRPDGSKYKVPVWTDPFVFIYRRGSGNAALDALFTVSEAAGSFFPFIPLRINNKFVGVGAENSYEDLYEPSKKATRKAIGAKFDTLIDKIKENPSLKDIDYTYAVFGVSLNVKENSCRRYIYEFFKEIMRGLDLSNQEYLNWKAAWTQADMDAKDFAAWQENQEGNPPPQNPYPPPPEYKVNIRNGNRTDINYDITITWSGIRERVGSGKLKPDAKVGELWFEVLAPEAFDQTMITNEGTTTLSQLMENVRLNWQVSANTWRSLDIYGLEHRNMIYGGKSVDIMAVEALNDGEESGFIIPLHEDIYRRMSIKDATQMSTACCFLVFNCYKVVKQKWYQTTWFKVILIIVIIVISIVTMGGGAAASVGLLGTNAAVGAAVGLAGTAAIIAGAIINAIAAMIVSQIISYAAKAVLGDKIGAIVGAVISIVALNVGSAMSSGASLAEAFNGLMSAQNLMQLTVAGAQGYASAMQADATQTMQQTRQVQEDYTVKAEQLATQYEQMFGTNNGIYDPNSFAQTSIVPIESPQTFLDRTMMVGSDIADMSMAMINNYADINLRTELPI